MDADGLPLVGPGIDYTKVEAVSQKKTVAFLNHFLTHTSRFLNRFSNVCEEKLEHLHGRLAQLEISMNILDAKISSIPGLESVTAPQSSTSSQAPAQDYTSSNAPPPAPSESYAPPPPPGAPEAPAAPEPAETKPHNPVSQDPRFMKYFKMVQVGVHPQAVAMKMQAEGLDSSLLDNPDAPAPDGAPPPPGEAISDSDSSDEADSDFSD